MSFVRGLYSPSEAIFHISSVSEGGDKDKDENKMLSD
jgi:hypothetical protein